MSHDYIPSCGCNDCTINRLHRELGDARQSIIDLQGANAAYVRANGRLHSELRAAKLLREGLSNMVDKAQEWFEALEIAHRHLDMPALRVSHPKDAAIIDAAFQPPPAPAPEPKPYPGEVGRCDVCDQPYYAEASVGHKCGWETCPGIVRAVVQPPACPGKITTPGPCEESETWPGHCCKCGAALTTTPAPPAVTCQHRNLFHGKCAECGAVVTLSSEFRP